MRAPLHSGQVARKAFVSKPLSLRNKVQSVNQSVSHNQSVSQSVTINQSVSQSQLVSQSQSVSQSLLQLYKVALCRSLPSLVPARSWKGCTKHFYLFYMNAC